MMVELDDGTYIDIWKTNIKRIVFCPKKMLDNRPLEEIEEYVRQRREAVKA